MMNRILSLINTRDEITQMSGLNNHLLNFKGILIDEVQKAPELFEQIKVICDESDEKGLIWLTGSQQYKMMERVRETLAGRIGILELYSLSEREKAGEDEACGEKRREDGKGRRQKSDRGEGPQGRGEKGGAESSGRKSRKEIKATK